MHLCCNLYRHNNLNLAAFFHSPGESPAQVKFCLVHYARQQPQNPTSPTDALAADFSCTMGFPNYPSPPTAKLSVLPAKPDRF